ncbi:DBH-like monooxygenase protein 1 homolog [Branchiostoma floridae]|uniref:DBH-like monooxygenase protein 1 homolog n=1 Tax=Branchiostoma floridae TaxID=7739 RepID=A0A9J7KQN6_BRAFL|nr:DBH-like monooxygenase protein 1 homolog [Branchiostoma floridae]
MARIFQSFCVIVLALVPNHGGQALAIGSGDFTHHEALDEEDKFHLFWKFDEEKIEFEAHVQTTGWVGLGLSPNGGMPGSDIVIGWVKDGTAHLTDRYADAKAEPSVDESQDWELVSGYENGTHTVLRFNRKLTTCDERDRVINDDTLRVIWAWHDEDPEDESGVNGPTYHGPNKGARATLLLERIIPDQTSSVGTAYTVDLLMNNVTIPNQDTTYWCHVFEMPKLGGKHHVIKAEAIVQPGNEGTVHHLLVYTCKKNPNMTIMPEGHPGHECYTPNMPSDWRECYQGSILVAWAIGSGDQVYPEHVGYPIGDEDDSGYVLMEMHYDNPLLTSGIQDSSGIRLTYTPELRDNDLGTLEVGVLVNKYHVVPPRVPEFTSAGFCNSQCLNAFLEEQGQPIHIIGVNLHSHLLGVKLNARLIRDGVETDIVRDNNYDFNLQFTRMLKEELTIYPGDILITECVYDSSHKDSIVYGGLGTPQEMCEGFFLYYPKFNLSRCDSMVNIGHTVGYAGVQDFTFGGSFYADIDITAPAHMVNMSYEEVMAAVQWTPENGQIFSDYLMNSTFYSTCQGTHQSNVDIDSLRGWADPFPRGVKRATEDICSRSSTPTPDPVGGSTALRPRFAAVYAFATFLLSLAIMG